MAVRMSDLIDREAGLEMGSTRRERKRTRTRREDRIATALERIAGALEARNVIDGQMAEFAELLQQGAPQVAHEGHPDLAPDGLPRKRR